MFFFFDTSFRSLGVVHHITIVAYFLTGIQKMLLPNFWWSHTAAAHMNESSMSEIVDTGNQLSNKDVDWQKSILCIIKYKNTKIKCIYIQNTLDLFKGI